MRPETEAQSRRVSEIAETYPSVRVTPSTGPGYGRAVIACPDGRTVVVNRRGEVVADSSPPRGYDPAVDALIIETCDGEWTLVPPWRCAMSAQDHLPAESRDVLLDALRDWYANVVGVGELRVWALARGGRGLEIG